MTGPVIIVAGVIGAFALAAMVLHATARRDERFNNDDPQDWPLK